jgi:hypothetical protein
VLAQNVGVRELVMPALLVGVPPRTRIGLPKKTAVEQENVASLICPQASDDGCSIGARLHPTRRGEPS